MLGIFGRRVDGGLLLVQLTAIMLSFKETMWPWVESNLWSWSQNSWSNFDSTTYYGDALGQFA